LPEAYAYSTRGIVASEVPLASMVGAAILSSGGNAVDAAVATSMALAVTLPHLGGFGGDFFMLYRDPDGGVHYVAGNGQAPRNLTRELVIAGGYEEVPERGPLSPVVPGLVGGLYLSWKMHGSMEWSSLLEPARRLAANGFPAPASLARSLSALSGCLARWGGAPVVGGDRPGAPAKSPGNAALIAELQEYPQALYRGEPAERVEGAVQSAGGVLDARDLAAYEPQAGEPLRGEALGAVIYEMPPPTQGATTLHILYMVEEVLNKESSPWDATAAIIESAPRAYHLRDALIGDPRFMDVGPESLVDKGRLEDLLEEAARRLPDWRPTRRPAAGDTTFFAVADAEGGIVAGIQSLFYPFGSCVTEPNYGITLNNRARGFTLREGLPNSLRPGARPMHTLSAVIVEPVETPLPSAGGEARHPPGAAALGASAGHYRPQMHALFLALSIGLSRSLLNAINHWRILWSWEHGGVAAEGPVAQVAEACSSGGGCPSRALQKAIAGAGGLKVRVQALGVANAVEVRGRLKAGYTDKRGDGVPVPAV